MSESLKLLPYAMTIMLYMATSAIGIVLYMKWRNKHYLNFAGAAALAFAVSLGTYFRYERLDEMSMFLCGMLACSFAAQQVAYVRLFQPRKTDKQYVLLAFAFLSGIAAAVSLSNPPLVSSYLLMLLSIGIGAFAFTVTARQLGNRFKYKASLALYACYGVLSWLSVVTGRADVKHLGMLLLWGAQLLLFLLLIERMIELMQAATYSSSRDETTGLFNARYFRQLVASHAGAGKPASLVYVKLNQAESYKASNGIAAYHHQLTLAGKLAKEISEGVGHAGRLDDEGIAILLTDAIPSTAKRAEQLRQRIEDVTELTASIGYVTGQAVATEAEWLIQAKQAAELAETAGGERAVGQTFVKSAKGGIGKGEQLRT
jgi:GGDEF domain-containing protein